MGDRAQLEICWHGASFFLYTHGSGSYLPQILQNGLTKGRPIWSDRTYCLGTVVREFIRATGGLDTVLNFGVGLKANDNDGDYRVLLLDLDDMIVYNRTNNYELDVAEFMNVDDPIKAMAWS